MVGNMDLSAFEFGVGVGKEGFGWSGVAIVHDKQEWPDWYPPKEMLQRRPDILKAMSELQGGLGMRGGPLEETNDPPAEIGIRARHDDTAQFAKDTLRTSEGAQNEVFHHGHVSKHLKGTCHLPLRRRNFGAVPVDPAYA